MNPAMKIVSFDTYCKTCVWRKQSEVDPKKPCDECLNVPARQNSHKPINYKKGKAVTTDETAS